MSTTLRRYAPDQSLLLPPDVRAWLPEGHLAHHVSDLVDGLDLTAFYAPYEGDGRRNAPYEPRNFTDPESGIMKTSSEGFQQCYNAQVAVDGKHQLVVATDLTANASDQGGLPALLDDVAETFGRPTSFRESSTAQTPRARSASRAGDTHPAGRSAGFHRFLWEDGDHLPGTSFICAPVLATSWSRTLRAALAPAVGLKACRFGAVPGPCAGWIIQPRGAPGGLDNLARRRNAPAGSFLRPLRSSLGPLSPVALSLPWRPSARADVREARWPHSPRLRIVCLAAGGTGEAG